MDPSNKLPSGVSLWTDHNRRYKYVLSNPRFDSTFKLDRTSQISHEQTNYHGKR